MARSVIVHTTAACILTALISIPAYAAETTEGNAAPAPAKPVPGTSAPAKPAPVKPVPATPTPGTAAPAKPAPSTTPAPVKPAPAPVKPAPVTPAPNTQAPVAPAPATATLLPAAPVYCGSYTPFRFRVTAFGKDPDTRASFATDIINKYLGGAVGKFTTRLDPKTKNVRLLLNNDLVAIISPADATAEKIKTSELLAAKWVKLLSIAFEASKAQR